MSSQRLSLAPLVAILAVSACQEDLPQSPTESSVPQADLLQADAKVSGKDLIAFISDRLRRRQQRDLCHESGWEETDQAHKRHQSRPDAGMVAGSKQDRLRPEWRDHHYECRRL